MKTISKYIIALTKTELSDLLTITETALSNSESTEEKDKIRRLHRKLLDIYLR